MPFCTMERSRYQDVACCPAFLFPHQRKNSTLVEQLPTGKTDDRISEKSVSNRVRNIRSDFWSGDLYTDMKSKGLFQTETDMAFIMSSDGVKVFKSRHTFCIWPMILVCLNLPPEERFKRRNILVVGFTPGLNNPKDMDSYLWPLVQEFITLDKGLDSWNGYREKDFQLKAYITIVTGDMPGRAKMQGFKGSRASRYCPYCYIQAVNLRSTLYYQLHLPTDLPATKANRNRTSYNPLSLPLRNDHDTRKAAQDIVTHGGPQGDQLGKLQGINMVPILSRLRSIDVIRSFPPDGMHLWWENVIPDLVKHWRGKFNTITVETREDSYQNSEEDTVNEEGRPAMRIRYDQDRNPPTVTTRASRNSTKFSDSSDPWNVPPMVWDQMGKDMASSASLFPAHFGEAPRDVWDHLHHLKASEWKTLGMVLLPIYLKDTLPEIDYQAYMDLLKAIRRALDDSITPQMISLVRLELAKFLDFYEHQYYQLKYHHLPACLPVFHQIAHVADFLKIIGPMWIYSQWVME